MFLLPKQGNDFGTVIKENAELFKDYDRVTYAAVL